MIHLKYLVTGTGRSGTVYLAKLLSSVGISCGHESIFDFAGINIALQRLRQDIPIGLSWVSLRDGYGWFDLWALQADSSYMAAPYLEHHILNDTKIIHVVRNPLLVVSSFLLDVTHFQENPKVAAWDAFIEFHLPEIAKLKTPIEKAIYYYIKWNLMVEKQSNFLYRVEDNVNLLFNWLDIHSRATYFNETHANTFCKRTRNLTLEEIPEGSLKQDFLLMFQKYGYPVEDVPFKPPQKILV